MRWPSSVRATRSNIPHSRGNTESAYNTVNYFIVSRQIGTRGEELRLHTSEGSDGLDSCWDILHVFKYTSKKGMMTVSPPRCVCCILTPLQGAGSQPEDERSVLLQQGIAAGDVPIPAAGRPPRSEAQGGRARR